MAEATLICTNKNTITTKTTKKKKKNPPNFTLKKSETKMMSCEALTTVSEKNSSRMRSAKPEWDKSLARFIKSLSMQKEKERSTVTSTHVFASLSFTPFVYDKVTEERNKIFSLGSEITGSPDNFVCRQRYLRSYVFTREDKSVVEKVKRLLKDKKRGKGKVKGKSENTNSCSSCDNCLKVFLRCIAKVDVQIKGSSA